MGQSCRGGAPWDECMWHKTARQQIDDDCAAPAFLQKGGYGGNPIYGGNPTAECVADNVAKYIGTSKRTCPGDTSGKGADCYYDKNLSTCPGDVSGATCYYDKNLFNYGSTQVAQCPGELDPFRRRKLTRSGTHSDAMKTKGVFTLTASGSK